MSEALQRQLGALAMFSPLVLYLLALNPWFSPEQHDDVLYYFGAVALLQGDGFLLGGTPITDWPPVFPAMLAALMQLTGASIWVAKGLVIAFVAVGIWLSYAIARLHDFPAPRAIAALTALLPIGLISGAAVLSEWPFLALSLAFLWALARLTETRLWRWALVAGVLLALASLTRFIGVFLGAAIVLQMCYLARRAGARAAIPELVAAIVGAVPWLLWKGRCQAVIASGAAPGGAYDNAGYYLGRFSHLEPLQLLSKIEATLFSAGKVGEKLLGLSWFGVALGVVLGIALVTGMALRFRRASFAPADAYVLVCLLLLLGDLNKPERYFFPLAPFLLGYLLEFGAWGLRRLRAPWGDRLAWCSIAGWIVWLGALNAYLLFVGNANKTRAGFSMIVTRSAEEFYRGDSLDLYRALRWADENHGQGAFAAAGFHGKYVLAFTGRAYRTLPDEEPGDAIALVGRSDLPPVAGWRVQRDFGAFSVYQRERR